MKKIINIKENIVDDMLNGYVKAHSDRVKFATTNNRIILRKNSKIGSHSTVLPNVEIGENSIIGAHSLVNKNIPANVVAYGIPAKIIREINEK